MRRRMKEQLLLQVEVFLLEWQCSLGSGRRLSATTLKQQLLGHLLQFVLGGRTLAAGSMMLEKVGLLGMQQLLLLLLLGERLSHGLLLGHVGWQLKKKLHWRCILVAALHVVHKVGGRRLLMLVLVCGHSLDDARIGVLLQLLLQLRIVLQGELLLMEIGGIGHSWMMELQLLLIVRGGEGQ